MTVAGISELDLTYTPHPWAHPRTPSRWQPAPGCASIEKTSADDGPVRLSPQRGPVHPSRPLMLAQTLHPALSHLAPLRLRDTAG